MLISSVNRNQLQFLVYFTDSGIHSEMFSDGVVEFVEAGVITNFLMGTRRLYDFVDHNESVAIPSTARKGTLSKIVPLLDEGFD